MIKGADRDPHASHWPFINGIDPEQTPASPNLRNIDSAAGWSSPYPAEILFWLAKSQYSTEAECIAVPLIRNPHGLIGSDIENELRRWIGTVPPAAAE
jgi:hypothetical protein